MYNVTWFNVVFALYLNKGVARKLKMISLCITVVEY